MAKRQNNDDFCRGLGLLGQKKKCVMGEDGLCATGCLYEKSESDDEDLKMYVSKATQTPKREIQDHILFRKEGSIIPEEEYEPTCKAGWVRKLDEDTDRMRENHEITRQTASLIDELIAFTGAKSTFKNKNGKEIAVYRPPKRCMQ